MTNVDHFLAARDVPLPFSLPSPGAGEETLEAQRAPTEDSLAGKTMGSMRRGLVRMTSSLRIKHAEDFGRRSHALDKGQKGKLPDESEDYSSDNTGDVEGGQAGTEGLETRNMELRNVVEEGNM